MPAKNKRRQELMDYEFCIYSGSNGSYLRVLSRKVTGFILSKITLAARRKWGKQ